MKFSEVVEQVRAWPQRQGRVSYRALKREFDLDDEYLQDLKAELIDAQRVASDEEGKVLVWVGASPVSSSTFQVSGSQSPDSGPRTPDAGLSSGERRQLTVMFCDLVGSTALSTQLDPEELREVIQAYRATCATVIRRFEGYLAKYIGDGLLVYFGYPLAHEDDAQRAARAGLEIVEALQKRVPSPSQGEGQGEGESQSALPQKGTRELQVRIGIHTGLVVAGEMGVGDQPEPLAIVGETPNLAARLQQEARPNTVVISAATYHLIQGYFACADLGVREVKGVPAPLQVYQVLSESGVQSRLEVAARRGLTPLVSREQEVRRLLECWEQGKDGTGQVVLLSGEAGIGKSRLVRMLREQIAGETQAWLECHCSPYHQNSALYPVIELVQRVVGFTRDDSPEEKLRKLEVGATHASPLQIDTMPLLAHLLSLPLPERYPPLNLTPQRQKQETLEAVLTWLLAEAERQPLAFIVEDLHWADPSTLEFLGLLIEQVPAARLLTLLAFRPEFTSPWTSRSHISHLTLQRLPRQHVEAMVGTLTGDRALPVEVVQQIVTKTDGVPLFVEELTKTVMESGLHVGATHASPVPPLGIPATLNGALVARLDRLGTAKEIAQVGATLGREFSYEVLHVVLPLDEAALQQGLRQLVEAELLYQRGLPPQATYLFKHALIQDAAYQSLLKSTRQQYHRQIAQVLEERFPDTKETQPELLAYHYTEAGLIAQAIPYWQRAGERATQRSAHVEAISHLTKGIELLKTLSDTPERIQQELTLQITLGGPLIVTRGAGVPEVEQVYARARELCQQIGETPQIIPILRGLQLFHVVRAEYKTARELAEQLLSLARRVQDPVLLVGAHLALAQTLFVLGELASAREHLEQGIALYDPQQHRFPAWAGGHPGLQCLVYGDLVLRSLGYPDQALKRSQEALTLAQELSHPYNLALALWHAAGCHLSRGEWQIGLERVEAAITLSTEQGFPLYLAGGTIYRGWALAEQGEVEEGIAQMQQGLAALRAMGTELFRPQSLAVLAEAYGKVGQVEEGLTLLAGALAVVDKTGERWFEAELYRLKGQLTLQAKTSLGQVLDKSQTSQDQSEDTNSQPPIPNSQTEAEACLLKAIEIARQQQAKSLELQAVMSLSRLWQSQGKKEEAHEMLAEIYGWFTEGFDTKDLQEAKALLEELS